MTRRAPRARRLKPTEVRVAAIEKHLDLDKKIAA